MSYISTVSMRSSITASLLQSQAELAQAQKELGSSRHADLGLTLGADTGATISLTQATDRLSSFTAANATITTRLSATDSSLTSLVTSAQSMAETLISSAAIGSLSGAIQSSAQGSFQSLIAGLNATAGGQSVFGGINTSEAPIDNYFASTSPPPASQQAISDAIASYPPFANLASDPQSISADDMQSFLDNQLTAAIQGPGWTANWSTASSTAIKSQLSPGNYSSTSVTANETAFQKLTQAYTMLTEFANKGLNSGASGAVIATATKLLNDGISGLTTLQSSVSAMQGNVSDANDQMSSLQTILQQNITSAVSVDPTVLSSQIATLQSQLTASYEVTSQLKSLSLVNYLTGG